MKSIYKMSNELFHRFVEERDDSGDMYFKRTIYDHLAEAFGNQLPSDEEYYFSATSPDAPITVTRRPKKKAN